MKNISIKWLLVIFALVSFYLMMTLEYDNDFRITAVLPLTYALVLVFILRNSDLKTGLGAKALVIFYVFRMCILPVICAMGNFYLEPEKKDYIQYYKGGVLLIVIECITVFGAMHFYTQYFKKKSEKKSALLNKMSISKNSHHFLGYFILYLSLIVFVLQIGLGFDYYKPITSQFDQILSIEPDVYSGPWWYIADLLSTWWRPLLTIYLIYYVQKKEAKHPFLWILFISILNIYFLSERRIFALLVGGFALYYASSIAKSKLAKRAINIVLLSSAAITLFYCFNLFDEAANELQMVARTFQRYFSGPTLNALALRVFDSTGFRPLEFICLLFNDFQSLTGLFGNFQLPDYYTPLFGMAVGLWTPAIVGSFSYFGPFFPLVHIYFVYFIKRCDFDSLNTSSPLYSMLYSYLGICVSCYMVMYTVELIFYFIIVTGGLFRLIIFLDKRIKFKRGKILICNENSFCS